MQDCGEELALIQLDFSAAFDRVNHVGLMYKLQNAGIGGPRSLFGGVRELSISQVSKSLS